MDMLTTIMVIDTVMLTMDMARPMMGMPMMDMPMMVTVAVVAMGATIAGMAMHMVTIPLTAVAMGDILIMDTAIETMKNPIALFSAQRLVFE